MPAFALCLRAHPATRNARLLNPSPLEERLPFVNPEEAGLVAGLNARAFGETKAASSQSALTAACTESEGKARRSSARCRRIQ
mmetsp:Transcript_21748/g.47574  ORF Transcript_21748/g.47574 Transcript_21748/m.47574 type:complete len:83 (+) Transcript_21748:601-849(+)